MTEQLSQAELPQPGSDTPARWQASRAQFVLGCPGCRLWPWTWVFEKQKETLSSERSILPPAMR